jgi:hypothetical protein
MAESGAHDVCTTVHVHIAVQNCFKQRILKERKLSIEFPSSTPGGKMQNFPRFLPQYFLPRDSFLFRVEENVTTTAQILYAVLL